MSVKFCTVKKFNQVLSCAVVKAHAIKIAKQLGISDFKASLGWLYRHNKKYGFKSLLLSCKGNDVDPSDQVIQKEIGDIKQLLKGLNPEMIYNMDETGLFYKKMPNCTYVTHGEMKSGKLYLKLLCCKKGLTAKDCVTVTACCNATGSSHVPLQVGVIGQAATPEVFKLVLLPDGKWVLYSNQSNAWMDHDQCQKWFYKVFVPHVCSRQSGKVYLLWDNCSGHKIHNWHRDIVIVYLPPCTTLWFQPMDQGILEVLK
eukprot:542669-Rhodomonas_salina.1